MNFRPRRRDDVEINVTSLIDVILLLLIFFMVSSRFVEESKIDLTLPSASKQAVTQNPDAIDITINKRGELFIDGKALVNTKISTIQQALSQLKQARHDPMVVITADKEAQFQLAVDAMDAARLAGLYRITFPTAIRGDE
ncbi:MAG: biopolymer transporter ExbD [Gammaproteobacteria bacterium]|nr:biopolymer transporter ExbD [Gammaproteobacteria bacterium]